MELGVSEGTLGCCQGVSGESSLKRKLCLTVDNTDPDHERKWSKKKKR